MICRIFENGGVVDVCVTTSTSFFSLAKHQDGFSFYREYFSSYFPTRDVRAFYSLFENPAKKLSERHSVVMAGLGLFPPPAESLNTCNNAHTVWSAVVQPPTFVHGSGAVAACRIKVCGE